MPPIEKKLRHLEHIEDLIIDDPINGIRRTVIMFQRILRSIQSQDVDPTLVANIKIDGSPSLVFGPTPANEPNAGEFFVGTKSALSPRGKRYTRTNIETVGEENPPSKAAKLTEAFNALSTLNVTEIYQGDLLFTPSEPAEILHIGGCVKPYVFTPNVITYAVAPASPYYDTIATTDVGIVIHTRYEGASIQDMYATFNPPPIPSTRDVLVINNRVRLNETFDLTTQHLQLINEMLLWAEREYSRISPDTIATIEHSSSIQQLMKRHINKLIRQNIQFPLCEYYVPSLTGYVNDWYDVEVNKLSTSASKARLEIRRQKDLAFLSNHEHDLRVWSLVYATLVNVKQIILNQMESLNGLLSFYEENGVLVRTAGEGLVIADVTTNEIVKLVDRYEFSRINFAKVRDWTK